MADTKARPTAAGYVGKAGIKPEPAPPAPKEPKK